MRDVAKRYSELSESEKQRSRDRCARYRERHRERLRNERLTLYQENAETIRARKRTNHAKLKARDPDAAKAKSRAKYQQYGKAYARQWQLRNPEKVKKAFIKWKTTNPRRVRDLSLIHKYGIGLAQYETMLERQSGACAICKRAERSRDRRTGNVCRLSVDHCHTTGEVRGLLCKNCNAAIGLLEHDPDLLDAARGYLRRRH